MSGILRNRLADHYASRREGLLRILKEKPDLKVIGDVEDGLELLNLLSSSKVIPHTVILDLPLPNLKRDGIINF